jgi:hypothetical protein
MGNIITKPMMFTPASPGTALLAMSAMSRIAMALVVAAALWLCIWLVV